MNNTVKKKTDRDVGADEASAVPDVSVHATPSSAGALYGVEVGQLNRQVKRNLERFPDDFMFQLSHEECLRCQLAP